MTEVLLQLVLNTNQSIMRVVSKNCILAVWIVLTHESKLYENMKHEIGYQHNTNYQPTNKIYINQVLMNRE
jgi:hypothetical protein